MQEMEDLKNNIEVEEEEETVRKEKKFTGGLSGEAKALVEKYEKEAKLKHKSFTNIVNNGILFVLKWIDDKPFLLPVWSLKENKKIDIEDIKTVEITENVALLENVIKKSEEIRATYED
jgi:hypothetical protein